MENYNYNIINYDIGTRFDWKDEQVSCDTTFFTCRMYTIKKIVFLIRPVVLCFRILLLNYLS